MEQAVPMVLMVLRVQLVQVAAQEQAAQQVLVELVD
jgi:hypothetical protein